MAPSSMKKTTTSTSSSTHTRNNLVSLEDFQSWLEPVPFREDHQRQSQTRPKKYPFDGDNTPLPNLSSAPNRHNFLPRQQEDADEDGKIRALPAPTRTSAGPAVHQQSIQESVMMMQQHRLQKQQEQGFFGGTSFNTSSSRLTHDPRDGADWMDEIFSEDESTANGGKVDERASLSW
eukprot:CAMPEP_0172471206 /NCGR_PEP_ID=MMETSP1065-20121228/67698_1 /TAXON_ID=265537 /ORGANISM="Amphiprora paludosa, Strain CCMP125" /LENGTH=176 /DNA_ID=CAMNT_0013229299 /DNA_START=18 /DNA_END=548 /DNA_ORIENTATION=-